LWREQLRIQRDAEKKRCIDFEANRRSIPYSKEINYPKTEEISHGGIKKMKSPMDSAINKLLDQVALISTEQTTLSEALKSCETP
jgi:hypothetical protein